MSPDDREPAFDPKHYDSKTTDWQWVHRLDTWLGRRRHIEGHHPAGDWSARRLGLFALFFSLVVAFLACAATGFQHFGCG